MGDNAPDYKDNLYFPPKTEEETITGWEPDCTIMKMVIRNKQLEEENSYLKRVLNEHGIEY